MMLRAPSVTNSVIETTPCSLGDSERAAAVFLVGLEDEVHGAVEAAVLGQVQSGA
jgi:hypothetical protein